MSGFINMFQTKDERQHKYWLARAHGLSATQARRLRDFRLTALERRVGYFVPQSVIDSSNNPDNYNKSTTELLPKEKLR